MDWLLPELDGSGGTTNEATSVVLTAPVPVWPRVSTPPPASSIGATSDTLLADLLSSIDSSSGPTTGNGINGNMAMSMPMMGNIANMPLNMNNLDMPEMPSPVSPPKNNMNMGINMTPSPPPPVHISSSSTKSTRETRALRRREFHKIHTRRSRAKLNDKMDKLLAALPPPGPGVVIKSKAQILDYAINVLTARNSLSM